MAYLIKEIFYSIQGEGAQVGRPAVFVRFAGCNLWSGKEADRSTARCKLCDTDFLGTDGASGGSYDDPVNLTQVAQSLFPSSHRARPFLICTGGEPLLQLDDPLVWTFHEAGFEIGVETNGTILPPPGIDWVCVSPKGGVEPVLRKGDELKLLFPQKECSPEEFETLQFTHFFLQPIDGPNLEENTRTALEYCLNHPKWRLSIQIHKLLGVK
jgi:7-carboxy-7-deazaguanine synthase